MLGTAAACCVVGVPDVGIPRIEVGTEIKMGGIARAPPPRQHQSGVESARDS